MISKVKKMKRSILFVDDEKQILNSLRRVFMGKDYNLYFALSGEEALEILDSKSVDLIISDMRMPNMDGIKLLSIVKDKYPKVIRMILSGYSDEKQALGVFENNLAISYILKPWDNEKLLEIVDSIFKSEYIAINEDLVQILNDIEKLPLSMKIYNELCGMINEDENIDNISRVIEEDPTLTLKILSIVNSAFYALKTGSIKQALNYLGLDNIKNLVFLSCFIDKGKSKFSRELDILWNHLVTTNNLIIKIYKEILEKKLDEEFSTVGLLHDLGKIVIITAYDTKLGKVPSFDDRISISPEKEKQIFKNSHEEIGAYILSRSGMPEYVIEAALFHHDPLNEKVKYKELLMALHLADYCSWRLIYEEYHIELNEEVLKLLNISKDQVEDLIKNYKK